MARRDIRWPAAGARAGHLDLLMRDLERQAGRLMTYVEGMAGGEPGRPGGVDPFVLLTLFQAQASMADTLAALRYAHEQLRGEGRRLGLAGRDAHAAPEQTVH